MMARVISYGVHGLRQIAWINGKKWEDHMRDEEEGSHEAAKRRMTGSKTTIIAANQPAVHQLTTCCTSRKKPLVAPRFSKNLCTFHRSLSDFCCSSIRRKGIIIHNRVCKILTPSFSHPLLCCVQTCVLLSPS